MAHDPGQNTVTLTTCDQEPIHILARVQGFGFLVAFSADWMIAHVSANVGEFAHLGPDVLLGRSVSELFTAKATEALRTRLKWAQASSTVERLFAVDLFGDGRLFDTAIHTSGRLTLVEAEPSEVDRPQEALSIVRSMLARLRTMGDMSDLFSDAAQQVREVTGYDRVMVYKFHPDESGEVIAEARVDHAPSYIGLRYPASDIPRQARVLYTKNLFRIIADVADPGVPLEPPLTPSGAPIDLSQSVLRAVSLIHLEYLRNMGVGASLSISIVVEGKLWGLFACHHLAPRVVPFDRRTAMELFAELFSLELTNRMRQSMIEVEAATRDLHDKVMTRMAVDRTPFENLSPVLPLLRSMVHADGVGVWIDGEYAVKGTGLTRAEMLGLVRFLHRAASSEVYATHSLGEHHPPAEDYADRVAGVLAIPVSRSPRDYLVFFRREVAQSVMWAGDPKKPAKLGPNGLRLTPRKSFDAWREVVRGSATAWTPAEVRTAQSLRVTFLEVILRSIDHSMAERKKAQETQALLISELNHRVRNILTLIRGIVRHTKGAAASVDEFSDMVGGRIQSLARAHDQLTQEDWAFSPLRVLLSNEVEAYEGGPERVTLTGPNVSLVPKAYTCLALVLHEMVTNSAKYGALSDAAGRLRVRWQFDDLSDLAIEWEEAGGPAVSAPKSRGFGSSIIERAVPFELGGEASIDFALTGVRARFKVPAQFVHADAPAPAAEPEPAAQDGPVKADLGDATALLVEDNVIIAMDAEDMLRSLGFAAVEVANSAAAGLSRLSDGHVDCAVLDINLGNETSIPIAEACLERGIPVIFASGYGDPEALPPALRAVPIVIKPYAEARIRDALLAAGLAIGP
ncbi:MAG: HWE histidine kinase domain-containing protein [Pseudomonadota bacterium]